MEIKVLFIKYVHEHLTKYAENVSRLRDYICPSCNAPLENKNIIKNRLQRGLTDVLCGNCEGRVGLIDLIEEKFASSEFLEQVRELDRKAQINLDNESLELILVGQAYSIAGEAGQIFRATTNSDWGIDGEIELKDYEGKPSGERLYLQLKSGDSYLYERKKDGKHIFRIKNTRQMEYWQKQRYPVMLVIRNSDGNITWMNISEYLKKQNNTSNQIVYAGESFSPQNLVKIRDRIFKKNLISKFTRDILEEINLRIQDINSERGYQESLVSENIHIYDLKHRAPLSFVHERTELDLLELLENSTDYSMLKTELLKYKHVQKDSRDRGKNINLINWKRGIIETSLLHDLDLQAM